MKLLLTRFSMRFPWVIVLLTLLAVGLFGSQFPKVHFDNDPENMLDADEPVRLFHHQVKEDFALYDFVIVGIVNEENPDGIFNVGTLGRIHDLTYELLHLQPGEDGHPQVQLPDQDGKPGAVRSLDLTPESAWQRGLNTAFKVDPHRLFTEEGESAIIGRELIAPSVVDNLKQAELGSLKLEYLMEHPPKSAAEARQIRDDAMSNPLYYGTLVAEDGKAICLYLPIVEKTFSYNVANLVRELTDDWPESDQVHITGLPVAEDTFGVEMLVQMATSAPLAMLAIFILLLLFFRRVTIVIAPMLVAMGSVICTMGLLIGLGFDVHIMSSMIAIFLMPIAVADSVHVLSEFYDTYAEHGNKRDTMVHVMSHLFMPMLYTTMTTMAGFGSLVFTPIPPVKVFGAHVAFGVGLAWLLTMTLVPAYIMLAIPERSLQKLQGKDAEGAQKPSGRLNRGLEALGGFSFRRWPLILGVTVVLVVVAVVGISRIKVNDNPVKWFTEDHDIRVADDLLNKHFGGTYTAYLTFSPVEDGSVSTSTLREGVKRLLDGELAKRWPQNVAEFRTRMTAIPEGKDWQQQILVLAAEVDDSLLASWSQLGDEIAYLDPAGLNPDNLASRLEEIEGLSQEGILKVAENFKGSDVQGERLLDAALAFVDQQIAKGFLPSIQNLLTELTAPPFKQPAVLAYLERLQQHLVKEPTVGKSTSAVDALKKASFELQFRKDRPEAENRKNFSIPDSVPAVAQVYTQLEGMKKKDSLFHLVTRDYREANLWVQLTSGDNQDMESVVDTVDSFIAANPPPVPLQHAWAGLTYLNVVWQDKMVNGMLASLGSSFVVVLVMMMVLFRSVLFGILAMLPLSVTITLIYGIIGLVGKDYDMPVAVLSAMTLGLSVDFAIHFLERARHLQQKLGSWQEAAVQMFKEPAMAISRNAIIISIGFTPLLVAPLVPYKTVGFFLATIMAVSWLATLFLLPALLTLLRKFLFGEK